MTKKSGRTAQLVTGGNNFILSKFAVAALIYACFAVYLYYPHLGKNSCNILRLRNLFVINACLASLGCFALSRRWVASFCGSLFAGAIYGFGPFMITLASYHPTAGFLASTIPWLFCPAAFGTRAGWKWLNWLISALPFLVVMLFFEISAHWRLFAVPVQARLHLADITGLVVPLVTVGRSLIFAGFYHIPIAPLIMGFSMLLAARRLGIIIIFCSGTILTFCGPLFNISPIIWLAIPVLCCSILIGAGIQGFACAGPADRKWILAIALIMAAFSLLALLMSVRCENAFGELAAEYTRLFAETARIYLLGAVATAAIYLVIRANLRLGWLRLAILCLAIGADVFFGARFIIDKVF
jgi:hypothetical protein